MSETDRLIQSAPSPRLFASPPRGEKTIFKLSDIIQVMVPEESSRSQCHPSRDTMRLLKSPTLSLVQQSRFILHPGWPLAHQKVHYCPVKSLGHQVAIAANCHCSQRDSAHRAERPLVIDVDRQMSSRGVELFNSSASGQSVTHEA